MRRRLFATLPVPWLVSPVLAQAGYRVAYNEATGSMVPLVKAIYADLGMAPVFDLLPSERALAEVNAGKCDADLVRVEGVEKMYPNLVCTKEPIRKTELYAYAKRGSNADFKTVDELQQRTLGFARGSKLAEEFVQSRGWQASVVNSADSLTKMLAVDRFEIALITSTQLLPQNALSLDGLERVGPVLKSSYSYHVLNKKHAELVPRFDAVLRTMKADGRMAKYLAAGVSPMAAATP